MKQSTHMCLKMIAISAVFLASSSGCYSPAQSQTYFVEASLLDSGLEPIYSTSIYTVYFDYALARCVIHSAHTWGQSGGGGGGTGIGITAFRCDPNRIRQRAAGLGFKTYPPKPVAVQPAAPSRAQGAAAQSPSTTGGYP